MAATHVDEIQIAREYRQLPEKEAAELVEAVAEVLATLLWPAGTPASDLDGSEVL